MQIIKVQWAQLERTSNSEAYIMISKVLSAIVFFSVVIIASLNQLGFFTFYSEMSAFDVEAARATLAAQSKQGPANIVKERPTTITKGGATRKTSEIGPVEACKILKDNWTAASYTYDRGHYHQRGKGCGITHAIKGLGGKYESILYITISNSGEASYIIELLPTFPVNDVAHTHAETHQRMVKRDGFDKIYGKGNYRITGCKVHDERNNDGTIKDYWESCKIAPN